MELRKHQIDCIDNIKNHFENDSKALIKMFCGSGKSLIIYNCLLEYTNNLSVVVVPSINLITQFNRDYLLNNNTEYELLTVCSKNELAESQSKLLTHTTDEDIILEFLEQDESKIILITYQSLKTLIDIVKENEFEIDLMCFDEAHHILGDGIKTLLFGTDEEDEYEISFLDNNVSKTLFFTATPKNSNVIRMYETQTEITIGDTHYDIVDDENDYFSDEPHCGKMIYEYIL